MESRRKAGSLYPKKAGGVNARFAPPKTGENRRKNVVSRVSASVGDTLNPERRSETRPTRFWLSACPGNNSPKQGICVQ
jgi:hypothetical protein